MVKEKRILSYFIGWLVLGFIVCFIGIKSTYALVINSSYLGQNVNTNFGITANSYKQGVSSITVDSNNALNYYVVDICTTLNNSFNISNVSNQSGNVSFFKAIPNLGSCNTTNYTGTLAKIYFKVNEWADAGNGNYGVIFSSRLNSTANYYGDTRILNIYTSNDTDNTGEIINNQTNILNNSINNSTNTITGSITDSQNNITNSITETEDNINTNIDNMESEIINSNKETQNVIKDQFNSCRPSVNIFDKNSSPILNAYIDIDQKIIIGANSNKLTYLPIKSNTTYTISKIVSKVFTIGYTNVLPADGVSVYEINNSPGATSLTITTGADAKYLVIRFMQIFQDTVSEQSILDSIQVQEGSVATKYEPYGEEICTNKLDEQNDKLSGIQGALTDSSAPNTSGLENSAGWLPAGPLDSILNLPLTMLNSLTNSLSKTCSPLNLTLPYVNKQLQIPCLSAIFEQITGVNELWTWVGTIASVLILYNYLLNLYAWVDRVLTLRAEFDEAMGADLANWGRL